MIKIAFQGAPGAFSHQSAKAFAKMLSADTPEFISCQSFGEVFDKVQSDDTTYGALPLENSSIGSIVANYDLLWSNDAFIISEFMLPVHHHLIGLPGTNIDEIQAVFSHPAALDQCRGLFAKHKNMAARVHWDTSGSVLHVKETGNKKYAAIAGEPAAIEYDMKVLIPNVEDFKSNATRFGLIAKSDPAADVGSPYKLSCAVAITHKPGSLANLLAGFSEAGANLTKIESRPIGESPWHYIFFFDMDMPDRAAEQRVLVSIQESSDNYKVLGRYRPFPK